MLFGVIALVAPGLAVNSDIWLMPSGLMNSYATAPLGCLVTAVTMLVVTLIRGWTPKEDLLVQADQTEGWLARSQKEIVSQIEGGGSVDQRSGAKLPLILGLIVWGISLALIFVVFW